MTLSADLLRGFTDTIILNHLRDGPGYGYQINKNISDHYHLAKSQDVLVFCKEME